MTDRTMKLIIDEQYMADLMTEELCADGPLSDLKVEKVSQSGGMFHIEMVVKKAEGE